MIKKYWKEVIFLILGVPIIFVSITYFLFDILPGNKIIEKNNWISFTGSYLGIIGVVGAVWWQIKAENEKLINEKKEKENDKILNLLNELIFFSKKDNFNNDIIEMKKIFSPYYNLYTTEKKYDIIRGNWEKILEEDRKILFSNKLDPFFFETISKINRINFDYFIFLEKRNYIKNIYFEIYNSDVLNDCEKKIIFHVGFNLVTDFNYSKETIELYLEKIKIKEWKNIFKIYPYNNQTHFNKIELFFKLIGPLYDYFLENSNISKDEIENNKKLFENSVGFLELCNKRIVEVGIDLEIMHKKAKYLKIELEKYKNSYK